MPARHLTVRNLLTQAFVQFTSVDGKLLRSLRSLILKPGAISNAYMQGSRKGFLGPIQLFLIANVLFIGVQSLTQTSVFSSPLQSHLYHQDWSPLARHLVIIHLIKGPYTLAEFAPLFDQSAILHAKSLIVLMVGSFSVFLSLLFYGRNRPFAAHFIFSLNFYAFLLLLFCGSLAFMFVQKLLGGAGLDSGTVDIAITLFNLIACAFYLHLAIGKVYGATGAMQVVRAVLLSVIVTALVPVYRFTIFLITLYSV